MNLNQLPSPISQQQLPETAETPEIKREWTIRTYKPYYFAYEDKVYRLDNDFCIFEVNPNNHFSLEQYYGCFSVHDRYDDEQLGYIEYTPLTQFTKVPRNVENYYRNIIFDHLLWACGCDFLVSYDANNGNGNGKK